MVIGAAAAYGRAQITEREAFADRAVESLEADGVRLAIEEEIATALADRGRELGFGGLRREIRSVIESVITSPPFWNILRTAALEFHRVFFETERAAARFDLGAVAPLLRDELRAASPELERLVTKELDLALVTVRRTRLAGETLDAADRLRTLGIVLPLLALAAFAGAMALARPHSLGVLQVGLAMVLAGGLLALAVPVVRTVVLENLDGAGALTEAQVQNAARDIYDAYLADLLVWALVLAAAGLLLSAAALGWSRLRPAPRAVP